MYTISVLPAYLYWHYTKAFREGFEVWNNILWFLYNFFSISLLSKTLFSKFRRLGESQYGGGIDVAGFFSDLIVNTIMRIIGFFLRFFVIIVGLISIIIFFFIGIAVFFIWVLLPLAVIFIFLVGLIRVVSYV